MHRPEEENEWNASLAKNCRWRFLHSNEILSRRIRTDTCFQVGGGDLLAPSGGYERRAAFGLSCDGNRTNRPRPSLFHSEGGI